VPLVAPVLPGKYCAFFRFVHGDNQRFGQKVWCDILVEEEPEVVKPVEPVEEVKQKELNEISISNISEQRVSSLLSDEPSFQVQNVDKQLEDFLIANASQPEKVEEVKVI